MFSTKTRLLALAGAAAIIAASWTIAATASGPAPLPQEPEVQYVGRLSGSLAVQYHNLDDLRMASTSVVLVRADRRHTLTPADTPPYTMVQATVVELLSGQPVPATVTVRQNGGPQYVMDYPWSQIMTPGREYVLFLADLNAPDRHHTLIGGAYERQQDSNYTLRAPDLLPPAATLAQLRTATPVSSTAPAAPKLTGCPSGTTTAKSPALPAQARTARQTLDMIRSVSGDRRPGVTTGGWQTYTVYNQADKPVAAYTFHLHPSGAGAVLADITTCR